MFTAAEEPSALRKDCLSCARTRIAAVAMLAIRRCLSEAGRPCAYGVAGEPIDGPSDDAYFLEAVMC